MYPKGKIDVCPRCGEKISYIKTRRRGDRVYYYAIHYYGYIKLGGKVVKKVRECYLGPETYIYVSKTHEKEGLKLKGMTEVDRVLYYLDALITSLQNIELSKDMKLKLAQKFTEIAKILQGK